jgi:glycosyltransferase involved in cell wall biosynthesis
MWRGAKISVIVPAFREERLIGRTLGSLPGWIDAVYVVDDASPDGTAEAVERIGDERVRLIRHAENRGVGATIATGYLQALCDDTDVLVVMAGDNQMHPEDLPALLAPVVSGQADYAKGNRFLHQDFHHMPWARRSAGRLLSLLTRAATGLSVDDSQCGYTALSADAARRLELDELWPRFGYPNDLLGMLAAHNLRVTDVPVRPVYADEQSGVRPWHILTIGAVILRRYLKPRRLLLRAEPSRPERPLIPSDSSWPTRPT